VLGGVVDDDENVQAMVCVLFFLLFPFLRVLYFGEPGDGCSNGAVSK
jgi:hypothetical protein